MADMIRPRGPHSSHGPKTVNMYTRIMQGPFEGLLGHMNIMYRVCMGSFVKGC